MAIQLALMIEGQEGLTWDRWRALARAAEETGYSGLFRSDHLPFPCRRAAESRSSWVDAASGARCASWPSTPTSGTSRASRWTSTRPSAGCWRRTAEVDARRARARAVFRRLPEDAAGWRAAGFLHGVPDEVRRDLARWESAGIGRELG